VNIQRKQEHIYTNKYSVKALIAKDIADQVYRKDGRFLKKNLIMMDQ
jgi:hypothetical protein